MPAAILVLTASFSVALAGCEDCKGPEVTPPSDAGGDAKLPKIVVVPRDASPAPPPRTAPKTTVTAGVIEPTVEQRLADLASIDAAIAKDARIAIDRITRARVLLDLGRPTDAAEALASAKDLGATPAELDAVQADVDWALGRYAPAAEAIRRLAKEHPTAASLLRRGRLEHDAGDEIEADRTLDAAEDAAGDNAFVLSAIYTQRGWDKLDVGKPDEARAWFAAGSSPSARRGLAAALAALGKKDEAIAILEGTTDLDGLATLARLSPKAKADARARIGVLVQKAPEAAAAPAARYYLDVEPDPKRAVEHATRAVKASPVAANQALLARAELESGDAPAGRTSILAALGASGFVASARIDWTAARVFSRLGESGKADELAARARRRNPRIENDEPPLKK